MGRLIGSDHPRARLDADTVALLREMYADGWSFRNLGRLLCISDSAVRDCVRGRTWRHVRPHTPAVATGGPLAQMAATLTR